MAFPNDQLPSYDTTRTALLFVDPYNDFLAHKGKLWPQIAAVADAVGLHVHLSRVVAVVRQAGIPVITVPHHRAEPGDMSGWTHISPYQRGGSQIQLFAKGSWGGEWHPDFVPQSGDSIAKEHWGGSGFANTDLDYLLKQRGISQVVLIGLVANTCIETTGRFAAELGYHVTLVRDATAAFTPEAMHSAHEINGPAFAHAILTTDELLEALSASAPTLETEDAEVG